MLPPADIDHEVRRHADALRSIAQDLLRDPHAADDVTQATLHKALTQRHLQAGPLGGWLQRVLENFVHQWRRGERRRLAREARVAAPEPEPGPAESLMRRESLRAVTDAVLQLDEPYQTTIFLRYFEDLPPRTIARRTGTNLATVKSRLSRGLAMLRQRLDQKQSRDGTDWRRGLASTFGLPLAIATTAVTVTTGAWIMGSTTKVVCAAGVLCAGGWFAFQALEDPAPPPVAAYEAARDPHTAIASSHATDEAPAPERETVPAAPPVEPWLDHPFAFELEVLVVDDTGLPVEGHSPQLAPVRVESNGATTATGPDGRTVLAWRSRTATGEVLVRDDHGLLHRVPLQHGRRTLLALAKQAAVATGGLSISFTSTEGAPILSDLPLVRNLFRVGGKVDSRTVMALGLHPHATFASTLAVVPVVELQQPEELLLRLDDGLGGSLQIESAPQHVQTFLKRAVSLPILLQGEPVEPNGITGIALGEDGKPAAAADVVLLAAGPQPLQRTRADNDGRFTFAGLEPGTFTVRAGGGAAGLATIPATVTRGLTHVQPALRREACVRGRVVRSDGKPAAPYRLTWRAEDDSWCDETTTADDNTFVFANLPAVPGRVCLHLAAGGLPLTLATHVIPDNGELLLRHEVDSCRRLLLEPVLPDACKEAAIEVRVWQLESGLGVSAGTPETGEPWCLEHVPPGWYQVEVRAAGSGFVDLGRHHLDGSSDLDLGRVGMPLPGTVSFVVPDSVLPVKPESRAFEVCELRADLDVRITLTELPRDRPLHLPAGNYVFAFGHRDGGVRFVPFAARAGRETIVTVPE